MKQLFVLLFLCIPLSCFSQTNTDIDPRLFDWIDIPISKQISLSASQPVVTLCECNQDGDGTVTWNREQKILTRKGIKHSIVNYEMFEVYSPSDKKSYTAYWFKTENKTSFIYKVDKKDGSIHNFSLLSYTHTELPDLNNKPVIVTGFKVTYGGFEVIIQCGKGKGRNYYRALYYNRGPSPITPFHIDKIIYTE